MASKTLSSSEFITFLLAVLGTDYDSIVTSITTHVDFLTPAQVYSHLLTHESRLTHQSIGLMASPEFSANTLRNTLATIPLEVVVSLMGREVLEDMVVAIEMVVWFCPLPTLLCT